MGARTRIHDTVGEANNLIHATSADESCFHNALFTAKNECICLELWRFEPIRAEYAVL